MLGILVGVGWVKGVISVKLKEMWVHVKRGGNTKIDGPCNIYVNISPFINIWVGWG